MPSNGTAKIVLARKTKELFLSSSWLCIAAIGVLAGFGIVAGGSPKQSIHVGSQTYEVRLASTPDAQTKGLSGQHSMASNEGMLFTFDKPGPQCMWMKDMYFPLDILWLDNDQKVVHLEKNMTPSTYPDSYCSVKPARFVIELNAGQIDRSGIQEGQSVSF